MKRIQTVCDRTVADSKALSQSTRAQYLAEQQLVPADIAQELTTLELHSERLHAAMEDKTKEFKIARTVRTEYLTGVDAIQQWLQQAELRIQDRTMEPLQLKETLNRIAHDIAGIQERLEGVRANGSQIIARSRSEDEKQLVRTTIDQLAAQLGQVMAWLDEKKHQVGDTLDAWTRFMNLYQIIMQWSRDKRAFIAEPMRITTLYEARQHLHEYSVGIVEGCCRRFYFMLFFYRMPSRVLSQL